jgi:hypothetical protein
MHLVLHSIYTIVYGSTFIFALLFCVLGSAHQFEEELAEQMGLYIHAGRGTGNNKAA